MALPIVLDPHSRPFRPVGDRPSRPRLVVVEGGRSVTARHRRQVYRRRRLVAVAALVLAVVGLVQLGGLVIGSSTVVPAQVEVVPGDTLWSIAGRLDLDADRRQVVALLADANGGPVVVPGQQLVIPATVAALG